jgi:hypothetical protein
LLRRERDFHGETRSNDKPHIAQNTTNRSSAIDARTTRHSGQVISQRKRKRTERTVRLGQDDRRVCPADAARRRPLAALLVETALSNRNSLADPR